MKAFRGFQVKQGLRRSFVYRSREKFSKKDFVGNALLESIHGGFAPTVRVARSSNCYRQSMKSACPPLVTAR